MNRHSFSSEFYTELFFSDEDHYSLLNQYDNLIIFIDSNLQKFEEDIFKSLDLKNSVKLFKFLIKASEDSKSLDYIFRLLKEIDSLNFTKNTAVVAIGGGIIGDISGFIASMILRGLDLISIPTTLLAMIDSSFGGKNGVNGINGKNRIGTIYHPKIIIINLNFLNSLDDFVFCSSVSESIKVALLDSPEFFDFLNRNSKGFLSKDKSVLKEIILKSLEIKYKFVKSDVYDSGQRRLLNFGHSFAHVIELLSKYKISHGEAVAIGMLMACKYSVEQKHCDLKIYNKIKLCFGHYFSLNDLQKKYDKLEKDKFVYFLKSDKKNIKNQINLVLINDLGKCFIESNNKINVLVKFIKDFHV